jgi:acyl dehydratase
VAEVVVQGLRVFSGLDELQAAVGEVLGVSRWHEVTQESIDRFAEVTGDHQWIHTDPERAAHGPYGCTIAHGYLTLSMIPMLGKEVFRVDGARMGINYGSERVRFPGPVLVGSKVRAGVELVGFTDTTNGARLTTRYTIESDRSDKPVCVADILSLIAV